MTTKYKKYDKVVVQVTDVDDNEPQYHIANKGDGRWLSNEDILGKLEDFQPAQEKIKMTVEEKKEFEILKRFCRTLYSAFDEVNEEEYPNLFKRLFGENMSVKNSKAQLEFARAWANPELIEVVKEEFEKGDLVRDRTNNRKAVITDILKNVACPIHVYYQNGTESYWVKSDLKLIKHNAINWEDGK